MTDTQEPSFDRGLTPEYLRGCDEAERLRLLVTYVATWYTRLTNDTAPADLTEPLFLESLVATEMTAVVEGELGVQLPLVDLLDAPNVQGIVQAIDRALLAGTVAKPGLPVVVARVGERFEPFGLTDVQHAYWLGRSGLFELGDVSTHLYVELESADFDGERASVVLRRLVERHDMLRAVVRSDGRQQVLERVPDVVVSVEDLSGVGEEVAAARVAAVRDELSHEVRPADRWPLFEVRAQVLGGGVTRVHVSFDLLVADASSIQVFLAEWAALYEDPDRVLPDLGLSFRDYVVAVSGAEGGEEFARSRRYWLDRLADMAPAPELPLVAAPGDVSSRFTRREFWLDEVRWARLREVAAGWGLTPSALLCAAYAEVLAVWSKSTRFTLNLTVADRLPVHPDVGRVIGDFTSLVLLEVDPGAAGGFAERARCLQRQLWRDLEHRSFGGVRVLRELARVHGPARAVMPVVFTSALGQQFGDGEVVAPGLGRLVGGITQTPQIFVDHQVYEMGGRLAVSWDAVEALFPTGMLDDAFAAYERLLLRLASDPDGVGLSSGPVVELAEPDLRVRREVNDTGGEVPDVLLHELVAAAADRRPDQAAVVSSAGSLSYRDLVSRARKVGRRLRELGVRPGELVAVSMDKGAEQLVAVLGVLESGAAYVPLDPGLPAQRLHHLLERTGARVVLTQSAVLARVPWPSGVTVLAVDDVPAWVGVCDAPLAVVAQAADLAYVIFTSGSTGQPKGVMIDHRGAVNTVVDVNRRYGLNPGDRVLAVSSLGFDLSVYDIFGVLAAGAAVVMPDPGTDRDPAHWLQLVRQHRVTVWNSVPALFELLLEQVRLDQVTDTPLRLCLLSGDWIAVSLPDRARAVMPGLDVISLGGATEASIWSIAYPVGQVDPAWSSIPYGRPLTNQSFHVLDTALRPCPTWVPGELYIGGIGLAMGYWKDKEKTDASFLVHPQTGDRLYRTGDLGRYLPDGTIEFLGREDFQVKIGGFRIELGEIETTLAAHPDITAAVVSVTGDPRGTKRLIAYLVTREDHPNRVTADDIRDYLRHRLPDYMVPPTVVFLDALPLTPNGKVDRNGLPDPAHTTAATATHTAAATPTEHTLTRIWTDLLGIEDISTTANLFELGADSLLALRATAAADNAGLHLTLRHIFEHPTITDQAAHTTAPQASGAQGPVLGSTGLTPSQAWFLDKVLPERDHWNDAAFLLTVQSPLDLPAFRTAVLRVLAHHDGLRLRFQQDGDKWRAWLDEVGPAEAVPVTHHDLSAVPSHQQKDVLTRIADDIQRSLSLQDGPIVRFAYFDLGDRPHCLLFIGHWLAVDHFSARVVLEDLLNCYQQLVAGDEPVLPTKGTSLVDWTRQLAELADSANVLRQVEYWSAHDRVRFDKVRLDRPQGDNDLESLESITVRVGFDVTEALLRQLPRVHDVGMVDVLTTALIRALPWATDPVGEPGQRRLLVDLERHGRDLQVSGTNVSRTVGRLSLVTPILIRFAPDAPAQETVVDIARQLREVPDRGAGYGLLRYLATDPSANRLRDAPQAEVGVNYVGQIDEIFRQGNLLGVPRMSFGQQRSRVGERFRVLDLLAYVVAGRLTITVGFSRNLHDPATAASIVQRLVAELTTLSRERPPIGVLARTPHVRR